MDKSLFVRQEAVICDGQLVSLCKTVIEVRYALGEVDSNRSLLHNCHRFLYDGLYGGDTWTSVSTRMGDHQVRPFAVNLGPFVGVDLNIRRRSSNRAVCEQTGVNYKCD